MKKQRKVILNENEYCYIVNKINGKIKLLEGPLRYGLLNPFKELYGVKKNKVILKEDEYAIILNPYDINREEIKYGDRNIELGPISFSPHYGEEVLIQSKIPILERDRGLSLRATKDFKDIDGVMRKAGETWTVRGPIRYEPHKYVDITETTREISLAEHTGIYIKNVKTGDIRLEKGAKTIMLTPDEELWEKEYTQSEIDAIRFKGRFEKTIAFPLWVLENEVTKIMSEKEQKIIFGPKVILLEPHERPYVMTIAGGTPKNTERLKIWKIKLGPNFSTDIIDVRTKDNAVVRIKLRYQWKFIIDENDHEKIFVPSDFVGLMTEMMAGIIRDEAAKHDFEELHSRASEIIKNAIFGKSTYYEFESGLRVFSIDIKEVVPKDEEIAYKLNEAIKSNMEIYVNKMKQTAKIEAEKLEIEGQKIIEEERKELIAIEHENYREKELIKTKVEAEQITIKAEADAKAISLKAEAEVEATTLEISALKGVDQKYLKLKELENLKSIKKMVVIPTDSKIFLPIKELLLEE